MENGQSTKAKSALEPQAATSDASIKSGRSKGDTGNSGSMSSSPTTSESATTSTASSKTWTSAELAALQSKIGLVAAALADFQTAGGMVKATPIKHPQGESLKIYLVAANLNLVAVETPNGIDFDVLPLGKEEKQP